MTKKVIAWEKDKLPSQNINVQNNVLSLYLPPIHQEWRSPNPIGQNSLKECQISGKALFIPGKDPT